MSQESSTTGTSLPMVTRLASPKDAVLITDAIYHALRYRRDICRRLAHKFISNGQVLTLRNSNDDDQIFGFIIGNPQERCCHFIYVKMPFRDLGMARYMFKQMFGNEKPANYGLKVTVPLWIKRRFNLTYDNFLLLKDLLHES